MKVLEKVCSTCQQAKPATAEYFGADKSKTDGFYSACKVCRSTARSSFAKEEKAAIRRHEVALERAKKTLVDTTASLAALARAQNLVTHAEKHLAKIKEPFEAKRKVAEAQKLAQAQEVELTRVKMLSFDSIEALQKHHDSLVGPSFETAREYLLRQIQQRETAIAAERQAEVDRVATLAKEQADADAKAAAIEVAAINEWIKPYLLTPRLEMSKRGKLLAHCKDMATKCLSVAKVEKGTESVIAKAMATTFSQLAKQLEIITEESARRFKDEYYLNGFSVSKTNWTFRQIPEQALLRHHTAELWNSIGFAGVLPDAPPVIWQASKPAQSLAGIEDRLAAESFARLELEREELLRQKYWSDLKQSDPKRFDKESRDAIAQVKGSGPLAQQQKMTLRELKLRDPAEYERQALAALQPRHFEAEDVIFLVPVSTYEKPHLRDEQYWPHGQRVGPGQITWDGRLRCWVRVPGPESMNDDFGSKQENRPGEAELASMSPERAQWFMDQAAEDSEWIQGADGHFRPRTGSSPWEKPSRIVFKKGQRCPQDGVRTNFLHGFWWSDEEVGGTNKGWSEEPPKILPDLPRIQVADFVATKPVTPIEEARLNAAVESPWQRWERIQKEDRAQESQILNGGN